MPQRSNLFQKTVLAVEAFLHRDAQVAESVLMVDRVTGEKREVDVVITGRLGGRQIVVSVEARAHQRRQGIGWIEEMAGKHDDLDTNLLVLVSESGFTAPARKKAEFLHIATITLETGDPTALFGDVLDELRLYVMRLDVVAVQVLLEGDEWLDLAEPNAPVFLGSRERWQPIPDWLRETAMRDVEGIRAQIGLTASADHHVENHPVVVTVTGGDETDPSRVRYMMFQREGDDDWSWERLVALRARCYISLHNEALPVEHFSYDDREMAVASAFGSEDHVLVISDDEGGDIDAQLVTTGLDSVFSPAPNAWEDV